MRQHCPLCQQKSGAEKLRQIHFPSWPLQLLAGPSAAFCKASTPQGLLWTTLALPFRLAPEVMLLCQLLLPLLFLLQQRIPHTGSCDSLWVMVTCLTLTPHAGPQSHAAGPAAAPCRTPSQQQQRPCQPPAAPTSQSQGPPGSLQERLTVGLSFTATIYNVAFSLQKARLQVPVVPRCQRTS